MPLLLSEKDVAAAVLRGVVLLITLPAGQISTAEPAGRRPQKRKKQPEGCFFLQGNRPIRTVFP
jgi:hypothetical protein